MRKFIIPLTVAMMGFTPVSGQETEEPLSEDELAVEQLINQYATVMLGIHINNRCKQLYPKATDLFNTNYKILDGFMESMMEPEGYQLLNEGVAEAGVDEVANPCGVYTFDFIQATAQIASTMAYNVQVFLGEIEPEPEVATTVATPAPAVVTPAAEKQEAVPKKETPPPVVTPDPKPEPAEQQSTQQIKTIPVTNIASAGETKKDMNKRQRVEVRTLRRRHSEELDNFKANQNSYPNPKAAKKALEDRQEAEMDALRKLHYEEDQAYRE